jgi:branched-subunit amino acid transport protein
MTEPVRFILGLAVMSGVTYLIRLLPLLFVKKKITNRYIRSFLYYIPYTVLTVMTFPTVFFCTGNPISGAVAASVCILLAYFGRGMITVALGGALSVVITECVIRYVVPLI